MKTDLFIRLIISAKTQHLYNLNGFSLFVHFHNNIDYRKEFLLFCRCTVTSQWILCIIIIVVTTITYIFITNRASLIAELVKNPPACRRPSSIPGLGLSPGEGIGYSFYYSWASLVAQLVKNLPAMRRPGFNPWVGKIPWRRERLPTPVFLGFPCGSAGKESACNAETWVQPLGWEGPLEKGKATHSSVLAWRIPWALV